MKHNLECLAFRPFQRNTLIGFATIRISELHLTIHDIALHQKGEARWAQLPAKPRIKDGLVVTDPDTGKIAYTPVLEFGSWEDREAFSRAVWDACRECMDAAAA